MNNKGVYIRAEHVRFGKVPTKLKLQNAWIPNNLQIIFDDTITGRQRDIRIINPEKVLLPALKEMYPEWWEEKE